VGDLDKLSPNCMQANHPKNPWSILSTLWKNRLLVSQMSKREISARYKESMLGFLWSILNPVLMLAVYTFVFGVVFKAKWSQEVVDHAQFALVLFCGLIVFTLFSECVLRSPTLILNNSVYVKKVVFPLETLAFVSLGTALFNFAISLVVLLGFALALEFPLHPTLALLPVVLLPLLLLILGLSWLLSSLGVFLRDINQIIGVLMSVLLFMSPIFFPLSAVPEKFHAVLELNPLAHLIEFSRDVVLWGKAPDWNAWSIQLLLGAIICWAGYVWFQKTRKGFADVL
jgi:lipopolysaccharide transport system permease protein